MQWAPGSVATVRTTRRWPHLKQSNSQAAWAGSFRNTALRTQQGPDKGRQWETGCCGGGQANGLRTVFPVLWWIPAEVMLEWAGWHQGWQCGKARVGGAGGAGRSSPFPRLAQMWSRTNQSAFLHDCLATPQDLWQRTTWTLSRARLAVWRAERSVRQEISQKLQVHDWRVHHGPDPGCCFMLGLTLAFFKAGHLRFDHLKKYVCYIPIFKSSFKGPPMNPSEARK